jgi:hypothetical protein
MDSGLLSYSASRPSTLMSGQGQRWTNNNAQSFQNYPLIQIPQNTNGIVTPITREQYEANNELIAQQEADYRRNLNGLAAIRIQNEVAFYGLENVAQRV